MAEPDLCPDPRGEAFERLGGRYDVRVLEPSPPVVDEPPFFADDPVAPEPRRGLPLLSPVSNGDLTWDDLARDDPDLAPWCAERWLGAWRPLREITDQDALLQTRVAWHTLAEHVLARARYDANGRIGLRFTRRGFGTPFFGRDEQVRIDGAHLVVVRAGTIRAVAITTPRAAADAVGGRLGAPADVYEPATTLDPDSPLEIDGESATLLGDWFGFGCSVLEELRARAADADPSRLQLWPEHFDLSVDVGNQSRGTRGTFGASSGDEAHPMPYLYVTHWAAVAPSDFWNDDAFDGASCPYDSLTGLEGHRAAALEFFARGRRALGT